MSGWHFSPKRPSDKTRDPVVSEFFSSDAIKNAGDALVREGIQNSLDARTSREARARVRLYVSGRAGALGAQEHKKWFESAWPHFDAPKNGLRPGSVRKEAPCHFLVFEDFGTTGLTGDRTQFQPAEGSSNAFFNFFRAEGKTDKAGDDRGRWGVGKQVFPRSSKAQAFFGYTETAEGSFLMGGCILKHHQIGSVCFKPDGYWGEVTNVEGDVLIVPTSSPHWIARFQRDFSVKRRPQEFGLSVVVPWLDSSEEGRDSGAFERNALATAVVEDYFIPIVEGRLEVSVEDPVGAITISKETYRDALTQLVHGAGEAARADLERVEALVSLAETIERRELRVFDLAACAEAKAGWRDDMLAPAQADEIRDLLAQGAAVRVNSTLTVRPKAGPQKADTFSCYLVKDARLKHRPCHVREDIIVPNVECPRLTGYNCIVRIDNGPLATLLGDSEGPAHTEWQASSRNFKDKYTYGGLAIDFVSKFPSELLRRVHATSKQLDKTLLLDIFQDRGPEGKKASHGSTPPPGPEPPIIPPLPRPEPAGFQIAGTAKGFAIISVGDGLPAGTAIAVKAAYETSKGNPFNAYDENDFDFEASEFTFDIQGCSYQRDSGNELTILIGDSKFSFKATGFDTNRDLVVQARRIRAEKAEGEDEPSGSTRD